MALTLIQNTGNFVSGTGDTLNITVNPINSNNLIIVLSLTNNNTTTGSVTEAGKNVYVQVPSAQSHYVTIFGGAANGADIWYAKNSKPGATTITITRNPTGIGISDIVGFVFEVSGADIISPVQQVGIVNDGVSTSTPSGGSVTTNLIQTFIASVLFTDSTTQIIHAGNEFTIGVIENGNASAYLIGKTTGVHTPQWDTSVSGAFCSSTVAFRDAPHNIDIRKRIGQNKIRIRPDFIDGMGLL